MNPAELPDIEGIAAEPDARMIAGGNKKMNAQGQSAAALVATGFIVLILAVVISGAFTLLGKDQLLVLLGAKSKEFQPDKTTLALQELGSQIQLFSQLVDELKQQQVALTASTDSASLDLTKLTQRVNNIERFTSDLEVRIAEHKKAQQLQVTAQKKQIAQAKPKPSPIIPVVLVSIRNQAGTPLVALRDGLDKSELLMPGDSWRGWTLLEANPSTKTARFKVAGNVQELRL